MVASVTIEGSLMPCSALPRGVRRTVASSDRQARRLVERGHAIIVSGSFNAVEESAPAVLEFQPDPVPQAEIEPEPAPDVAMPPAKNASRDAWAAFLRARSVSFPDGDEAAGELWAGRDDLIIIWQQANGGS